MTYVFDIDGTICNNTYGKYEDAEPIQQRINKVNKLFDEGHTIYFQTARGMGRSDNSTAYAHQAFYASTKRQLAHWGVKHHGLFLGKPSGDLYVDDKGMRDENFFADEDR